MRRLVGGLAVVAVIAGLVWQAAFGRSGYQRLAEQVGPERAERIVRARIPPALARQCLDRYGEDQALFDTVAAFVARNEAAMAELASGPDGVAALSADAKRDLGEEAMDGARPLVRGAGACDEADARVAAGEFDS